LPDARRPAHWVDERKTAQGGGMTTDFSLGAATLRDLG
jgi:hypothetical protein